MSVEYYKKHLQITQKKIETLETKTTQGLPSWKLYDISKELDVLKEIEGFLWGKL